MNGFRFVDRIINTTPNERDTFWTASDYSNLYHRPIFFSRAPTLSATNTGGLIWPTDNGLLQVHNPICYVTEAMIYVKVDGIYGKCKCIMRIMPVFQEESLHPI